MRLSKVTNDFHYSRTLTGAMSSTCPPWATLPTVAHRRFLWGLQARHWIFTDFFYILIFSVEVTSSQIVVFVCGVGMYHGSILNSPFLAGGPSGRSRKTCFYPWKACPSHKVLNPRMPVKGERTGYKLRNGIGGANRGTSPSIQNAFCCCL